MTAGNQTPPGGPSDAPAAPGQAPDGAVQPGTPADDRTDGPPDDRPEDTDRSDTAEPASAGEPSPVGPVGSVVPAPVPMLPAEESTSSAPPNGPPDGPEQPSEPADRFPASRLFEPFTPATQGTPGTPGASDAPPGDAARTGTPGPTVPWRPPARASAEGGDAPAPATERQSTQDDTGSSADAVLATGRDDPESSPIGDAASTPVPGAPATTADAPHHDPSPSTPPAGWTPAPGGGPAPGGSPATAAPGHDGPPSGQHGPGPVPVRVPPDESSAGAPTPPPAPAAPAATGRLRRMPVVLLVVAVLVAGLGYAGYRQLTGGPPDGFRTATSPGYELAVPQTWSPPGPGTPPLTVFGVPFGTAGQYGEYECGGARFSRAVAASALIAVPPDVGLDQAATAFARGSGEALYPGAGPQVAVGTPTERELPRSTGSRVEASVRTDGSGGCRATEATVQVLVVPRTTAPDGSIGAAVLLVSGDVRGGPPQPAAVPRDELVRVLDTAVLSTG